MQYAPFGKVFWIAIALATTAADRLAAQDGVGQATDRTDLAALVVTRDAEAGGHRARLATHRMASAEDGVGGRVSAVLFLPDGGGPAREGMIAFVLPGSAQARAGAISFRWHFAGMDTVVAFAARAQAGGGEVSYAAEITESDLLFLATAQALEVALPDGQVLVVDEALRRRLGLLARLSGLTASQRAELAALSRAIEESIRRGSGD